MDINERIRQVIFSNQDLEYKKFHSALMPTISENTIVGVRVPILRKIAKEFYKNTDKDTFLSSLPHEFYEENNIHAFIIEQINDYSQCIKHLNLFLPYIDNWATCDMLKPKILKKHKAQLLQQIRQWIDSSHIYTVRFGIGMLMTHYLDEDFKPEYFDWVLSASSDEYYVNMMIAWYFATALWKKYDMALKVLEENKMPLWVHNKTIQKAIESYRIKDYQKDYLRTLRRNI